MINTSFITNSTPTAITVAKEDIDNEMIAMIILASIFITGVIVVAIIAICFLLHKYKIFHQYFMNNHETSISYTVNTYDNPIYGTN